MKGLIGVLGGMGPAATVDIFNKFVNFTAAHCDQDHIPLIISSIPDIPDRTQALLHNGDSPLPAMEDYLHHLEKAGAECIVIPCNTAHYWYPELRKICHVHMLSIIETTVAEAKATGKNKVGLLATNATLFMGLYQEKLAASGMTCLYPERAGQDDVMESIYNLKSGQPALAQALMIKQAEKLFQRGAEAIVLGCTEVPIILLEEINQYPDKYIDSTASLVRASIKWYEQRVGKSNLLF